MIQEIFKYKRHWDYIRIKNIEVYLGGILVFLVGILLYRIDLYNNFENYRIALETIAIYIATGLLGLLGVIIGGMALLFGILDEEFRKKISKRFEEDMIGDLVSCFQFIILNIGFAIILFFGLYFSMFINEPVSKLTLYFIILFATYLFVFIIFYIISLTSSCMSIYISKEKFDDLIFNNEEMEKKIKTEESRSKI